MPCWQALCEHKEVMPLEEVSELRMKAGDNMPSSHVCLLGTHCGQATELSTPTQRLSLPTVKSVDSLRGKDSLDILRSRKLLDPSAEC